MAKIISTRGIRSARLYTADEAAKAVKVSLQCVRKWLREGLPCLCASRPLLIRGYELRSWIETRKHAKKRTRLAPHEFYCVGCKTAKTPLGNMIDCCENNAHSLMLSAICPTCEGPMKRLSRRADLPFLKRVFELQISNR
jgi:hypothetical protein